MKGFSIDDLNPYAGAIEAGAGAIKGITEAIAASQQADRAAKLRDKANQVPTQQIRPEFKAAQQNAQMASMYGLAGKQGYQDQINSNISNSIRAIKESSPNGEATLAAIGGTLANANKATNDLSLEDANAQERKGLAANQVLWNVGAQQRSLEDKRDAQQAAIRGQAAALENAATANKQTGINDALGGVEQGASQVFKKNTDDGSTTPVKQTIVAPLNNSGFTSIPSGGGISSLGLSPYNTPVNISGLNSYQGASDPLKSSNGISSLGLYPYYQ